MVYLLCFDKKFKHAKHYIGFAENKRTFEARMKHHSKGSGSRLMAAIAKAGIAFQVARTWEDGDRNFERKLKNRKKSSQLCPICAWAKKLAKEDAKRIAETGKRLQVIEQENKALAELNENADMKKRIEEHQRIFPQIMDQTFGPACPVVQKALEMKVEVPSVQSASPAIQSRWQRIWSSVARFFRLRKSDSVSK